jgi:RNA 3'-terminal phosphate cyclase (ATP)
MLTIDGRQGEGGGQVLRTCLSLSALTGRPFRLDHIRANRSKPGLRPQHLTAVRALAAVCAAEVSGDRLDSRVLEFRPQAPPQPGRYRFDVADAAQGGSAGAVTLILGALLWPLLFAGGPSEIRLHGGTHVPMSPSYHYLSEVAAPHYRRMGATFTTRLEAWGWYPVGQGVVTARIEPLTRLVAPPFERVRTREVAGVAAVTNLPADIPQRMAGRATNLLAAGGYASRITPLRERGAGPGAGIFLWVPGGGAGALGRRGLPADQVAEAAVAELLPFVDNTAMVDPHLADQILLPLAVAHGRTHYTTNRLTLHTLTLADLLRQWLDTHIEMDGELDGPAGIHVTGAGIGPNTAGAPSPLL